jgi:nucleoid-associated protein YgaU
MALRHRVTCSLATLTLGVIAALPFYQVPRRDGKVLESSPPLSDSGSSTSTTALALQIPSLSAETTGRNAAGTPLPKSGPAGSAPSAIPPAAAEIPDPPPISSEFPEVSQHVPAGDVPANAALSWPEKSAARGAGEAADLGRPSTYGAQDTNRSTSGEQGTWKTHRIRDGDSLPRLAHRYLGSADRWREILNVNRDVIVDPELLPVGKLIRIPPTAGDQRGREDGSRPGHVSPADPPITTLVPIE